MCHLTGSLIGHHQFRMMMAKCHSSFCGQTASVLFLGIWLAGSAMCMFVEIEKRGKTGGLMLGMFGVKVKLFILRSKRIYICMRIS